jgi:hypothetical protein
MHEPVEDRGAHRVVAQVCAPILHNAVGRDDNASMQFVALMDQRLQQRAGGVGDRTRQEQVIQHEQIALEDGSQPGFALGSRAQRVTVEEVVGLKILQAAQRRSITVQRTQYVDSQANGGQRANVKSYVWAAC